MLQPTLQQEDVPVDLTVWTTFTEATKENGCMKFMPGSHRTLYYDESKQTKIARNEFYKSVEADSSFYGYDFSEFKIDPNWEPDESKAVALEMQVGECVIFTARCVHASYPNITKRSTRFAIAARYVPTHVKVYPGQDEFYAHGAIFNLKNYGCVIVSGSDDFGHNSVRYKSNLNEEFPSIKQQLIRL